MTPLTTQSSGIPEMTCPTCGTEGVAGQPCQVCQRSNETLSVSDFSGAVTNAATLNAQLGGDGLATAGATYAPRSGGAPTVHGSTPAATLRIGQQFGPRYHIIRTLGVGGMGAVYQAWDTELALTVALKTIRPEYGQDRGSNAERQFKQELVLARQVTHPNVIRIHDLGDVAGTKYITMPYVEGTDLSCLIAEKGTLDVAEALSFARQVAAGLRAAHDVGIVHRDLKPANILIGEGRALITDFGIARTVAGPAEGSILGTPWYMAPEQARGQAIDARADIYAFGLILYEMLAGPRAKSGASPFEDLEKRIRDGVPSVRSKNEAIPAPLDALVARCVEVDPAARYQSSAELIEALDRLDDRGELKPIRRVFGMRAASAAMVLFLFLLGGTWWFASEPAVPVQPPPVSVLVSDFVNRTGDSVFNGTLEPALIQQIETASFINAYPRRDALQVARNTGAGADVLDENVSRLVAIRENIGFVLAGAIEQYEGGYRIAVRLMDPATENAEPTSLTEEVATKAEVLPAMTALAERIREELGDTTEREERDTSENPTAASLEAVKSYTIASDLAVAEKNEEAIEYYKRATQQDPNLGRAYSGWALSADKLGRKEESAEQWKKALALIPRMTEREQFRTWGLYYSRVARDQNKAKTNFESLVSKYPADGAGHNNLALTYFRMADFKGAMESGRRVLDIYPRTLLYRNNYALYAMYASDFPTAEAEARKIIADAPESQPAYLPLAIAALATSGDVAAARDAYVAMAKTTRVGASHSNIGLADIAMLQGRYGDAVDLLVAGSTVDAAAKMTALQAAKQVALAEAYLAQNRTALAVRAAESALKLNQDVATVVPAARVLIAGGKVAAAEAQAIGLANRFPAIDRAYGKILEAEILLNARRVVEARDRLVESTKLADLWLARYMLGIAYMQGGAAAEALTEFESCLKRRGEAASLFLDDVPTYRYAAPLYYWLGRAQQDLGQASARDSFQTYIALRKNAAPADPLAADAARRLVP